MLGLHRSLVLLMARRPGLLPALLGLAWAARSRHWLRRLPFLPLPPSPYLRWRMDTAYGDPDARPPVGETARFLEWARRMRRES